jgi:hypothetical protein
VHSTAFFEVFQDATLELVDLAEASHLKERGGLLAADATGTEADDWSIFHRLRELRDCFGKFPEVTDRECDCTREGAEFHFIGIPCVE